MNDKQEAALMFIQRVDIATIASELGVSEPTVYQWLHEQGTINDARSHRNALVAAAYAEGWTIRRICMALKVSQGTVYGILHTAEVQLRRRRRPYSNEESETIVKMYVAGKKLSMIVNETDRSLTYIYRILDRYGVPRRRSR